MSENEESEVCESKLEVYRSREKVEQVVDLGLALSTDHRPLTAR